MSSLIATALLSGNAPQGRRPIAGLPHIGRILGEMLPPDLDKVGRVGTAIVETFQMALVGTSLGIVISFFLAILASRLHSPFRLLYFLARMLVSFFRTVPDLVWALLFVVAVGLGHTVFGDLETESEILEPTYRSHGSLHEIKIPLLIFNCKEDLPSPDEFTTNLDLTRIPFRIT